MADDQDVPMPMSTASSVTLSSSPTPSPPDEIPFSALFSQAPAGAGTTGTGGIPRSVLLFGLSANPPTGESGHLGIVHYLAGLGKWDEVWVMPVYRHMHQKDSILASYDHRLNMCRLNFEGKQETSSSSTGQEQEEGRGTRASKVRVMKLEKEVVDHHVRQALASGQPPESVRVGTIDVVLYLKEMMPHTEFGLTLGTDTYVDLKQGKWKRGGDLEKLVELVVVDRPGVKHELDFDQETERAAAEGEKVSFHKVSSLSDVSSSAVRLTTDRHLLKKMLHPAVYDYIRSRRLFAFTPPTKRQAYLTRRRYFRGAVLCSVVLIGFILLLRRLHQTADLDLAVPKAAVKSKHHHLRRENENHST